MSNQDEQDEYRPIEAPMPPLPPEGSRQQPTGYAGPALPPLPAQPARPLSAEEAAIVGRYQAQGKKLLTIEELSRQAAIASEEARRELRAAESFVLSATPPASTLPPPLAPVVPLPTPGPARRSQRDCSQCSGPTNRANLNYGSRTVGYEMELTPVDQSLFDSRLARVQVYVCEDCGYVDLYATSPKSLRPKPKRR